MASALISIPCVLFPHHSSIAEDFLLIDVEVPRQLSLNLKDLLKTLSLKHVEVCRSNNGTCDLQPDPESALLVQLDTGSTGRDFRGIATTVKRLRRSNAPKLGHLLGASDNVFDHFKVLNDSASGLITFFFVYARSRHAPHERRPSSVSSVPLSQMQHAGNVGDAKVAKRSPPTPEVNDTNKKARVSCNIELQSLDQGVFRIKRRDSDSSSAGILWDIGLATRRDAHGAVLLDRSSVLSRLHKRFPERFAIFLHSHDNSSLTLFASIFVSYYNKAFPPSEFDAIFGPLNVVQKKSLHTPPPCTHFVFKISLGSERAQRDSQTFANSWNKLLIKSCQSFRDMYAPYIGASFVEYLTAPRLTDGRTMLFHTFLSLRLAQPPEGFRVLVVISNVDAPFCEALDLAFNDPTSGNYVSPNEVLDVIRLDLFRAIKPFYPDLIDKIVVCGESTTILPELRAIINLEDVSAEFVPILYVDEARVLLKQLVNLSDRRIGRRINQRAELQNMLKFAGVGQTGDALRMDLGSLFLGHVRRNLYTSILLPCVLPSSSEMVRRERVLANIAVRSSREAQSFLGKLALEVVGSGHTFKSLDPSPWGNVLPWTSLLAHGVRISPFIVEVAFVPDDTVLHLLLEWGIVTEVRTDAGTSKFAVTNELMRQHLHRGVSKHLSGLFAHLPRSPPTDEHEFSLAIRHAIETVYRDIPTRAATTSSEAKLQVLLEILLSVGFDNSQRKTHCFGEVRARDNEGKSRYMDIVVFFDSTVHILELKVVRLRNLLCTTYGGLGMSPVSKRGSRNPTGKQLADFRKRLTQFQLTGWDGTDGNEYRYYVAELADLKKRAESRRPSKEPLKWKELFYTHISDDNSNGEPRHVQKLLLDARSQVSTYAGLVLSRKVEKSNVKRGVIDERIYKVGPLNVKKVKTWVIVDLGGAKVLMKKTLEYDCEIVLGGETTGTTEHPVYLVPNKV